ncbi:MAG: hypothetical protein ACKN9V_08990 [Pseudomonadota bacterium]
MFVILTLLVSTLMAAVPARPVPRTSSHLFVDSGTFEGGSPLAANIEAIRFSQNAKEKTERWVIDFSDARTRTIQQIAPEFQIRIVPADKVTLGEGKEFELSPPRLIISLSSIKANYVTALNLNKLLKKSFLVKNIRFYPPIEDGDRAIEVTFKKSVLLEPHQPLQKEGRLVLDLKPRK